MAQFGGEQRFKYKICLINKMVTAMVDMGTVSARGQIAIPSGIRHQLGLEEGVKVLFMLEDDLLLMKKVTPETFAELTRPLREARKKIKKSQVTELVHKLRKT